jgi:hypothetical protein
MAQLSAKLEKVFLLLKKTQPLADATDVAWQGPYFIPRKGQWCRTHFTLYNGTLYAWLLIPPGSYGLSWEISSAAVTFEREIVTGDYYNNDALWKQALDQIEHRLNSALNDSSRYNRFVEKNLPFACRAGKVRRELTWPKKSKRPLLLEAVDLLEKALGDAKKFPLLPQMSLSRFLKTSAIAYNAGFKDLRSLSPLRKYRKKADRRHGGLLDLSQYDADAFHKWFHSKTWSGCHPWEIVFGHPHGIMLSPQYHENSRFWSYWLCVDSLGWYVTAARMAIALARHKIPFEFLNQRDFLDALRGRDDVDVGPDLYAVKYGDLKKQRPGSLGDIRWDPIPQISAVTEDQLARIKKAEQVG